MPEWPESCLLQIIAQHAGVVFKQKKCRSGMPDVPDVMPEWPEWDAGVAGVVKRTIGGLVVVELAENNRCRSGRTFILLSVRHAGRCRTCAGRVPDVCRTMPDETSGIVSHRPAYWSCVHPSTQTLL